MEESWRMRMGMPNVPPPPPTTRYAPDHLPGRSTEAAAASHSGINTIPDEPLSPEDFNDVFGGPPRTVLSGQFAIACQRFPSSSSRRFIYEEIFRPPATSSPPPAGRVGRSLPEFRIPGQKGNDFYSDIFGWEDHERVVRSRSRSKASSSSVLSSEELSPLRPAVSVDGHDDVPYFASNLSPINVSSRWTSRTMSHEDEPQRQQQTMMRPYYNIDSFKGYTFGLSRQNPSPEKISNEPISNGNFPDDLKLDSPSSAVSSVSQSSNEKQKMEDGFEDEDDAIRSYVIEINSDNRGACAYESNDVDEAVAWAKEKFQTQFETKNPAQEILNGHQANQGQTGSFGTLVQTETQILDEKIRMWLAGKGANIQLLLSSLHQILWPESGWFVVSLSELTEISQVKKAYQKARLCLHPDKLQQQEATIQQRYIADKAFSVLQDAWESLVAQRAS